MGYATVMDLIKDVASFYNDTDALNYVLPESTKRRILHYIQRTSDEIWYYRPWNFKMLTESVVPSSGEYALPYNFATIGPKGLLVEDSTHNVWYEIDYQEWTVLRSRPAAYSNERKFAIGSSALIPNTQDLGEGTPLEAGAGKRVILFPSVTESRSFTLYFEGAAPKAGWDQNLNQVDYTKALPLSEGFHNALLLGTIAKLQESKGDPRPQYRSEYIAALATATAQHLPLTSRMQQLPRALPYGRW